LYGRRLGGRGPLLARTAGVGWGRWLLQLPQLPPTGVLLGLRRIRIRFTLQPKPHPIDVPLVNEVSMHRLVLYMAFVEVNDHFDRLAERFERRIHLHRDHVRTVG